MHIPTLKTDRLILRPIAESDIPDIQKYFGNWNIIKNLSVLTPWPYPDNGAEDWVLNKHFPARDRGEEVAFAITIKALCDEMVGNITLRLVPDAHGTHRGFWLAEPYWGQGYMCEAVEVVNDYAFFDLGMERIVVTNATQNKGSRRVKEKTGANYLGKCNVEHHEGGADSELWEVTREGWAEIRSKSIKI